MLGFCTSTTVAAQKAEITKKVKEYTLGTALILGTDPEGYSNMIRGLKNMSLADPDGWPRNMTSKAFNFLSKRSGIVTSSVANNLVVTMRELHSKLMVRLPGQVDPNPGMPR